MVGSNAFCKSEIVEMGLYLMHQNKIIIKITFSSLVAAPRLSPGFAPIGGEVNTEDAATAPRPGVPLVTPLCIDL